MFKKLFGSSDESKPNSTESLPVFGDVSSSKQSISNSARQISKNILDRADVINKSLKKAKATSALNKALTQSFMNNTAIIINISKLLSEYSKIFSILDEISKKYNAIELNSDDMRHLRDITKEQMDNINRAFLDQTSNIKGLFEKLGSEEGKRTVMAINSAQANMTEVTRTIGDIKELDREQPKASYGGKKYKKKVLKGK